MLLLPPFPSEFVTPDGQALTTVTISLGIVEMRETDNLVDLVEAAGSALYRAKNAGRNRVEVARR